HRVAAGPADVVLHEDAVLEHGDLGPARLLPDHHHPVDRLPPGQELRLRQHRWTGPPLVPAATAPLPLRLQAGRPGHPAYLVLEAAFGGGLRLLGGGRLRLSGRAPTPPAAATTHGAVLH